MFGKREGQNSIGVPPLAAKNPQSVEILRVWAAPGSPQELTLRPVWKDPAAWGLMLVDIARHAAKAYAAQGLLNEQEVLARIREVWELEWTNPVDPTCDITPRS